MNPVKGLRRPRSRLMTSLARVAELEDTTWPSETVANILARAERAEAHIKELNDKWADDVLRVERAEAECKAMRTALKACLKDLEYFSRREGPGGDASRFASIHKARAALNPTPAGIKKAPTEVEASPHDKLLRQPAERER